MLKNKPVLDLFYQNGAANEVASLSDAVEELNEWRRIISEVMAGCHNGVDADDDTEECPGCGSKAPATKLLKKGCSICGWMSPRLRREEAKI